jgi:hypothetical protein
MPRSQTMKDNPFKDGGLKFLVAWVTNYNDEDF